MRIAVLSGKGGTGKTFAAVNMAASASNSVYADCDVEEPNGHLYLRLDNSETEPVSVVMPALDDALCNGCRKCADFCRFNALAFINQIPILFKEVCHSCGGCIFLCPQKALSGKERVVGRMMSGTSGEVKLFSGMMNPGEESGTPVLKRVLDSALQYEASEGAALGDIFFDGPPGCGCLAMDVVKISDYCLLVAEPTLFGAHNLTMIHELAVMFGKRCGVVLNKCVEGGNPSEDYCLEKGLPILGRIPFDMALARLNSEAGLAVRELPGYRQLFSSIVTAIKKEGQL